MERAIKCWEPSLDAPRKNSNGYINWALIKCVDISGIGAMFAVILHVCRVTCAGRLYIVVNADVVGDFYLVTCGFIEENLICKQCVM